DCPRRHRTRVAPPRSVSVDEVAIAEAVTVEAPASSTRQRLAPAAFACLVGAGLTCVLVLLHREAMGAIVVGVVVGAAIATIVRPLWGYYLLVSTVILADQYLWNFSPWTDRLGFYVFQNWWKLLSPAGDDWFRLMVVNSIDVLLLAMAIGVVLQLMRE